MEYSHDLIRLENSFPAHSELYSISLIEADNFALTLNGVRCYLGGRFILCLSPDDIPEKVTGIYSASKLLYQPYFINVNLSHEIIGQPLYDSMRAAHSYPDFHLFRKRDSGYIGIIKLSDHEFDTVKLYFDRIAYYISRNEIDLMWSCRARSALLSVLNIAENAYCGTSSGEGNEIIRYIKDNVGNELTLGALCDRFHMNRTTLSELVRDFVGMSPMAYVLEERLAQVLPDLLFTRVPVSELSIKYGFSSTNYFIRAFRKKHGISPLKYRSNGCKERRDNEGSYHKKELDLMFSDYMRKGLGRAITLLGTQTDKTPYRRQLIDFITSPDDKQRALGVYDKQLIDCFDDRDAIAAELAETLLPRLRDGNNLNAIPLLLELGCGGKASDAVEALYREAYAELTAYTKRGGSDGKYPPCARRYTDAAAALGKYFSSDDARMFRLLDDMAELYEDSDAPDFPDSLVSLVFAEADPLRRAALVMTLPGSGAVPGGIKTECRPDAQRRIRSIADKTLNIPTGEHTPPQ